MPNLWVEHHLQRRKREMGACQLMSCKKMTPLLHLQQGVVPHTAGATALLSLHSPNSQ